MWSTRQTPLAVIFALLGGLAWWLLQRQSPTETPAPPRGRAPDYVVSDFQAIETDQTGRPSRRLVAEQMRQFVNEDLAELDLPSLVIYQADGPPWHASSREGLLLAGGDEVRLSTEVRVERAGSEGNRPVRLDTSKLTIWPQRYFAQGDRPVRIESEQDWLTAQGLRLWFAEPVRADVSRPCPFFIAPEETPSPAAEDKLP